MIVRPEQTKNLISLIIVGSELTEGVQCCHLHGALVVKILEFELLQKQLAAVG